MISLAKHVQIVHWKKINISRKDEFKINLKERKQRIRIEVVVVVLESRKQVKVSSRVVVEPRAEKIR